MQNTLYTTPAPEFEDVVRSHLKHVSSWCMLFDPHITIHQSNTSFLLRKCSNDIHILYANLCKSPLCSFHDSCSSTKNVRRATNKQEKEGKQNKRKETKRKEKNLRTILRHSTWTLSINLKIFNLECLGKYSMYFSPIEVYDWCCCLHICIYWQKICYQASMLKYANLFFI